MEKIKLTRNGKIIERSKEDYEVNKQNYIFRGYSEVNNTPKPKPTPKPPIETKEEIKSEEPKEKPKAKKDN